MRWALTNRSLLDLGTDGSGKRPLFVVERIVGHEVGKVCQGPIMKGLVKHLDLFCGPWNEATNRCQPR